MHLEIYIWNKCPYCVETLAIAEHARSITGLRVTVIDLALPGQSAPPHVVAVPAYVLDGRVVSLGNPAREAFLASLGIQLQQQVKEEGV